MSDRQTKRTRPLNLPLAWLITILISAAVFYGSMKAGVAGDCKPGEQDGQCGLSSFVGLFDGAIAAGVILLAMAVFTVILVFRRRRQRLNLQ